MSLITVSRAALLPRIMSTKFRCSSSRRDFLEKVHKPHDPVQGSPDFVAHVGKELPLGNIRDFSLFECFAQVSRPFIDCLFEHVGVFAQFLVQRCILQGVGARKQAGWTTGSCSRPLSN